MTAHLTDITDHDFASATGPGSGLVVVDFTAEWCPPCHAMMPVLEAIAAETAGTIRFLRMDTDRQPATMARLGVRGLPTLIVFRDGEIVDRIIGAVPLSSLRQRLAKHVASVVAR